MIKYTDYQCHINYFLKRNKQLCLKIGQVKKIYRNFMIV